MWLTPWKSTGNVPSQFGMTPQACISSSISKWITTIDMTKKIVGKYSSVSIPIIQLIINPTVVGVSDYCERFSQTCLKRKPGSIQVLSNQPNSFDFQKLLVYLKKNPWHEVILKSPCSIIPKTLRLFRNCCVRVVFFIFIFISKRINYFSEFICFERMHFI